ncbi:gliding motility protein GldL [Rhodocytophaga rosea]|uniref:Gliding motility protein GldL n=1 Tax=Rhodocytophaga rosea TaxID=2704465 RepID=A0A6C0GLW1_9BACT|nr:gliding motility protein GldL [Rhodocytophaga rosea]QHT69018.1 gliding motility protein GldL [Rhodocytophaga rosea]
MSAKKGGSSDFFFNKVMPFVYGVGAAIVIVGAMFKIMHWPGAGAMLVIGLSTEAFIFLCSAFAPAAHEPDWTRVYPELADGYTGDSTRTNGKSQAVLPDANLFKPISKELVENLGHSMKGLSESVTKMTNLADASVATNEYVKNVQLASNSIVQMNKSYASTVSAMSEMATASQDAKSYHAQLQTITKNLGALNAVYELELQDTNKHLKAMNAFYGNLTSAMQNMSDASKDTEQFKGELSKLTTNLTSLNRVYGSMLSAMKGQ